MSDVAQGTIFDAIAAREAADAGINRAAKNNSSVLDLAKRKAIELGRRPVNPMEVNGLGGDGKPHAWAEYMRRDIPVLLGCEAIYLLPDWEDSKGACLEKYIADEIGMLVIYESKPVEAVVALV